MAKAKIKNKTVVTTETFTCNIISEYTRIPFDYLSVLESKHLNYIAYERTIYPIASDNTVES